MPTPGPVAYQPHSGRFVVEVISTGFDQVAPSSLDFVTQTVRVPLDFRWPMAVSPSSPRLWVMRSQTTPVVRSTTGQGLPQVLGPSSQINWSGCQVRPPSKLRLATMSMSPVSLALVLRPSQRASTVPLSVTTTAGMRNV